jgi:hypothetical protein
MSLSINKPLIVFIFCIFVTLASAILSAYVLDSSKEIFHGITVKNALGLVSTLAAVIAMLPLFLCLNKYRFFEALALPLKSRPKRTSPAHRFLIIIISLLFAGISFPFLLHLGYRRFPLPEDINNLAAGNGFIIWIALLTILGIITLSHWYKRKGRRAEWTLSDLGLEGQPEKGIKIIRPAYRSKRIIVRAAFMSLILTASITILICISSTILNKDINYVRSFIKPISLTSILQVLLYLLVYAVFFTINGGAMLYGQLRLSEIRMRRKKSVITNGMLTMLSWWGYSIAVILGALALIFIIHFIPVLKLYGFEIEPQTLTKLYYLTPLFAVFFFLSTWFYRKSGTIYTGSFVLAILAAWFLARGIVF